MNKEIMQAAILKRMQKNAKAIKPNNKHQDYLDATNAGEAKLQAPSTSA